MVIIEEEAETGATAAEPLAVMLRRRSSIVPLSLVSIAFIPRYVITATSCSTKVVPVVTGMRGVNTLSIRPI